MKIRITTDGQDYGDSYHTVEVVEVEDCTSLKKGIVKFHELDLEEFEKNLDTGKWCGGTWKSTKTGYLFVSDLTNTLYEEISTETSKLFTTLQELKDFLDQLTPDQLKYSVLRSTYSDNIESGTIEIDLSKEDHMFQFVGSSDDV